MKIAPTLQGGLRIDIESMLDWARLEIIAVDGAKSAIPLVESLASRMAVEADWRDYVMPDLEDQFSEQLNFLHSTLRVERSKNSETGSIHITKESADKWYGALNQARISLEQAHGVTKFEQASKEMFEGLSEHVQSAIMRYHFYTYLQSELLEHVMMQD